MSKISKFALAFFVSTLVATEGFKYTRLSPVRLNKDITHFCTSSEDEFSGNNDISSDTLVKPEKPTTSDENFKLWPCGDALDKKIVDLTLPAIVNFAIFPLVGAADTFWVGRMNNALALAGQGASNQVFDSFFWFMSFLPSVMTPFVAKAHGADDKEAVQDRVGESIFVGAFMGLIGMFVLTGLPTQALNLVLSKGSAARPYAEPYLAIRGLTFIPALLSTVGFAAFRGTSDIITPLRISIVSNMINMVIDPFLIFKVGMGVAGAAAATCLAEFTAFVLYIRALLRSGLVTVAKMIKPPSKAALKPLLLGGLSVQLRAVALNVGLLVVTRTTQKLDTTGTVAAAHAISIQLFQLGSVASLALSTVASILVPMEVAQSQKTKNPKGLLPARQAANRLMMWGVILGIFLATLQMSMLPLLSFFSPLPDVQQAARGPSVIGAFMQFLSSIIWTGEGIQQGNEDFVSIAVATALGTAGMLFLLQYLGNSLVGVWASFFVLYFARLTGALRHHFFTGPYTKRKMAEYDKKMGFA